MISLMAVTMLSLCTLYLGTYLAERLEQRCASCRQALDGYECRQPEQ
jgi:hypothetical protein